MKQDKTSKFMQARRKRLESTVERDEVSKIFIKWGLPTRQAAISDIMKLIKTLRKYE